MFQDANEWYILKEGEYLMSIFFLIIGGAAGGGLGWLFDKVTRSNQPKATGSDGAST